MTAATAKRTRKKPAPIRRAAREPMQPEENWPSLDRALVEFLDRTFPPPSVRPGIAPDTAMYEAGKRAVVDAIRHAYEIQRADAREEMA